MSHYVWNDFTVRLRDNVLKIQWDGWYCQLRLRDTYGVMKARSGWVYGTVFRDSWCRHKQLMSENVSGIRTVVVGGSISERKSHSVRFFLSESVWGYHSLPVHLRRMILQAQNIHSCHLLDIVKGSRLNNGFIINVSVFLGPIFFIS